jgi:hypothetical protein
VIGARPPAPRSAHRLIVFVLDGARCADRGERALIDDAIAATVADVTTGPGGADHQFAAVVYGDEVVRARAAGAPGSWPLDVPCAAPTRIDGGLVALTDLAGHFLAAAAEGLPASVDVLTLTAPGDRLAEPDDLRIRVTNRHEVTDLAGAWADALADLQAMRRHTVLLR